MKLLHKTYHGIKGLLSGMALTLRYFLRFDKVITQQYPENRDHLKLPDRTRSQVELVKDTDTGNFRCNACGLCVRACPNHSIEVERERDAVTNKNKLVRYVYHFDRCTVCGLCVDACREEALAMGKGFENAVYDSSELVLILNEDRPPDSGQRTPTPTPKAANQSQSSLPTVGQPAPETPA
jgi:NADH-quinone oxidoreductase subunit I